jgi:hypothetical protein
VAGETVGSDDAVRRERLRSDACMLLRIDSFTKLWTFQASSTFVLKRPDVTEHFGRGECACAGKVMNRYHFHGDSSHHACAKWCTPTFGCLGTRAAPKQWAWDMVQCAHGTQPTEENGGMSCADHEACAAPAPPPPRHARARHAVAAAARAQVRAMSYTGGCYVYTSHAHPMVAGRCPPRHPAEPAPGPAARSRARTAWPLAPPPPLIAACCACRRRDVQFQEGVPQFDSRGVRIYCDEVNSVISSQDGECRVAVQTALLG